MTGIDASGNCCNAGSSDGDASRLGRSSGSPLTESSRHAGEVNDCDGKVCALMFKTVCNNVVCCVAPAWEEIWFCCSSRLRRLTMGQMRRKSSKKRMVAETADVM